MDRLNEYCQIILSDLNEEHGNRPRDLPSVTALLIRREEELRTLSLAVLEMTTQKTEMMNAIDLKEVHVGEDPSNPKGRTNNSCCTSCRELIPFLQEQKSDLERREADVYARENRVWGWRMMVVGSNDDSSRISSSVAREVQLLEEKESEFRSQMKHISSQSAELQKWARSLSDEAGKHDQKTEKVSSTREKNPERESHTRLPSDTSRRPDPSHGASWKTWSEIASLRDELLMKSSQLKEEVERVLRQNPLNK